MAAKKTTKQSSESGTPADLPLPTPSIFHEISDLDQLKSLANPLRLKIIGEFAKAPRTTKQVAQILEEAPTKLYHHVDALFEAGLLRLVREVPKRGTTEKYYQAIARQFRVGAECLNLPNSLGAREQIVIQLLQDTKQGVTQALEADRDASLEETESDPGLMPTVAIGGMANATAEDIKDISKAISKALRSAFPKKTSAAQNQSFRFAFFMYPDECDEQ